jgi:hypothetical protein
MLHMTRKKPALLASPFSLTQKAAQFPKWDADATASRQKQLAEIAVKTWPLKKPSAKAQKQGKSK